jgi:hypothetical protein
MENILCSSVYWLVLKYFLVNCNEKFGEDLSGICNPILSFIVISEPEFSKENKQSIIKIPRRKIISD